MEDSQILDLYWKRDQQAISETAGKYGSFLWTISWNILRSRGDAEECVNDTYLRTWNAIPPARPAAFAAWLARIIRNLSLDRWKLLRAEKRGAGAEILLEELEECVPVFRNTEHAMEDREIARLISAFLRALPAQKRWIFLRRYWYGESVEEISLAAGCTQGKIKSTLFRLRKALRQYLEKEGVSL